MELVLFVLLIIYILFNIKTPSSLVPLVDNTLGNIVVLILAVSVLLCCNPILGILAFVAAYIFIQRSSHKNPDYAMNNYLPSEKNKSKDLSKYNTHHQTTLEEEIVNKMPELNSHEREPEFSKFSPVMESSIDSSDI